MTAARAVLALAGIDDPTHDQHAGALLVSEFLIKSISSLTPPKK